MLIFNAMMNDDGTFEVQDEPELVNVPEEFAEIQTESDDPYCTAAVADLVGEFNAIDSIRNGTFNRLVAVAVHHGGDVGKFTLALDAAEEHYILATVPAADVKRYASGEKAGKVKTAQYLSKTYQQAKSVIIGFLERGFDIAPGMGKTAMEKAIREDNAANAPKSEKTVQEKLAILAGSVTALLAQLPDVDRDAARIEFIRAIGG